jgi:hypothetical protein
MLQVSGSRFKVERSEMERWKFGKGFGEFASDFKFQISNLRFRISNQEFPILNRKCKGCVEI